MTSGGCSQVTTSRSPLSPLNSFQTSINCSNRLIRPDKFDPANMEFRLPIAYLLARCVLHALVVLVHQSTRISQPNTPDYEHPLSLSKSITIFCSHGMSTLTCSPRACLTVPSSWQTMRLYCFSTTNERDLAVIDKYVLRKLKLDSESIYLLGMTF